MTNNLVSQAATLQLGGVPNDIISNLNPISIIIFVPIMNLLIYPALQRMKIRFTPIKRIACGFFLASAAMISATITQYYIYKLGPCGNMPNTCEDAEGNQLPAPISIWVQIVPFVLIGFSEIMASVTSLEYAYTKAPTNMRSTIQAVLLFMNAISSAISQALVSLSEDPLLVWNYGLVAVLAAVAGFLFLIDNRQLDKDEDRLNNLPSATVQEEILAADEKTGRASLRDTTSSATTTGAEKN
jgi:POT family proton-dependent oligopeptide transporter